MSRRPLQKQNGTHGTCSLENDGVPLFVRDAEDWDGVELLQGLFSRHARERLGGDSGHVRSAWTPHRGQDPTTAQEAELKKNVDCDDKPPGLQARATTVGQDVLEALRGGFAGRMANFVQGRNTPPHLRLPG